MLAALLSRPPPLNDRLMAPGGVNERAQQDEAASNPGPFTPPGYIDELQQQQQFDENNRLQLRQWYGKQI